jgi:putative tricarboxylic transport membrane protein
MDFSNYFRTAFTVALDPFNLLAAFIGCGCGTLVGVLPGIGPSATISLLLPLTYKLSPVSSIIMLAGIYYGAQYGGSTTSILVNIPGESASVVTCLDGYQMAKKGRAGPALGISAMGSFIGGTFSLFVVMLLAPPLATMALKFGPPENFSVMFFGLTMVTYLASGSMIKSLIMGSIGLLLGSIGMDSFTGWPRYTFGIQGLEDGVGLIPAAMGLFGISEVLLLSERTFKQKTTTYKTKFAELFPTKQDWRDSAKPIARGSLVGSFLGLFPGGGPTISSFISYALERKTSRHPEKFGTGEIAGVAGPEAANNSSAVTSFIPLLCLGIPTTLSTGILLGGFMIKGILPGPLLMGREPELFWGVLGSLYLANVVLLILNLPLIGLWVKVLKIPYSLLSSIIFLLCLVGSYSVNNNTLDIFITIIFGVVGYLMKKFDFPPAPLTLAFILGPNFERYLGQSLRMGHGNPLIFFSRPISATLLIISIVVLVYPVISKLLAKKRLALSEWSENL